MDVKGDYQCFYSAQTLSRLAVGTGIGATVANTSAYAELLEAFDAATGSGGGRTDLLHSCRCLGDGKCILPVYVTAWAAGELLETTGVDNSAGDWSQRCLRATAVGVPPLLFLQNATGGSRPGETSHGSHWRPFQDDNGFSGHSFMSAVPFLTAAAMCDEPVTKSLCYAGSVVGPLSRIHDHAHYPSQAAMGWWLAYLAVAAVNDQPESPASVQFVPCGPQGETGAFMEFRY
ncbi:MAG: phosphatase PAP2 family protein [Planctomycetaceae bacterium]|nr:phosphatase PAP2 family protein [Planctomycetaceae bacterium]